MLFTLGYQALTPEQLLHTVKTLDAVLIDCRARPHSRKKGFGHHQLIELLADVDYQFHGHHLGGEGNTLPSGIRSLRKYNGEGANAILMCMEHHPADCHRHIDIAGPHFPDAMHIMGGLAFRAGDLRDAMAGKIEYSAIHSAPLEA